MKIQIEHLNERYHINKNQQNEIEVKKDNYVWIYSLDDLLNYQYFEAEKRAYLDCVTHYDNPPIEVHLPQSVYVGLKTINFDTDNNFILCVS